MKKNKKIAIALLLANGIFINILGSTSSNGTHSANYFVGIFAEDDPIGGKH